MAFQPETTTWEAGVQQLETGTPVQGGVGGAANLPLLHLSNRTAYLKQHVDALETQAGTLAPINSPAFTGTPTVPDVALGDRSGKAANTKFVMDSIGGILVKNVAGGANVNLTAAEAGCGTLVFTGALTANIAVIVPALSKKWVVLNSTTGGFTLTVKTAAGTGVAVTQGRTTAAWSDTANVNLANNDYPSIAMTGVPTAPTPANGDNSGQVATTAWFRNAIATIAIAMGFAASFTSLGYIKFPSWLGGFIIQWGSGLYASNTSVTFPLAFPNACWQVFGGASNYDIAQAAYQKVASIGVYNYTLTGFVASSSTGVSAGGSWIAFGT